MPVTTPQLDLFGLRAYGPAHTAHADSARATAFIAGVVRRAVHGHFPNRQALLEAPAGEATEALAAAVQAAHRPDDHPAAALARLVAASWPIGDRYRMLISLGRRDLGEKALRDALAPGRTAATAILIRGQRERIFAAVHEAVESTGIEEFFIDLAHLHDSAQAALDCALELLESLLKG